MEGRETRGPPGDSTVAEGKASSEVDTAKLYEGKSLAKDKEIYSYDFLTSLPDMKVFEMPELASVKDGNRVSPQKAAELGIKNAVSIGGIAHGNVVLVENRYTGRTLQIGTKGLTHGIGGKKTNRVRTNARLSAIAGMIVQNAVPVNALKDQNPAATGTYAMAALLNSGNRKVVSIVTVEQGTGNVVDIDSIDVVHAISGRLTKENGERWDATKATGSPPDTSLSTISIATLLDVVNITYRSILSDDVLARLGEVRPESGYYSDKVRFSHDLQSMEELRADNEAMREEMAKLKARLRAKTGQAEYWKDTATLKSPSLRRDDVRKVTRKMIKDYGSTLAAGDIQDDVAELGGFADAAQAADWAVDALQWAVKAGIINGKDGAPLDPQGQATRAEVAIMLMRYLEQAQK